VSPLQLDTSQRWDGRHVEGDPPPPAPEFAEAVALVERLPVGAILVTAGWMLGANRDGAGWTFTVYLDGTELRAMAGARRLPFTSRAEAVACLVSFGLAAEVRAAVAAFQGRSRGRP